MARIVLMSPRAVTRAGASAGRLGLRPLPLILLLGALTAAFLLSLAAGSVQIPLDQIVTVLLGGEAERASWKQIILQFRLPKAVTAMLAGAALGAGGLMMQTFFRNPLADPCILGLSSGASLGVALAVLAAGTVGGVLVAGIGFSGDLSIALAASIGAGVTMALVLLVARRVRSPMTLLILGLMFGYVTGAMVSLLLYFSIPERIQIYISWGFGSFGGVTWDQMRIFAPAILTGLALALALIKPLDALLLGEAYARSMGLNIMRARALIILSTGLLAGAVTAFCGPIGFIGVAVPHLCRTLFRAAHHRALLPACALMGALVALLAGLVAEVPGSAIVLPLNAVTALFGAPVVILVILRGRDLRQSFGS